MPHKIIYDRNKCIGAGSCEVVAPKFFKVDSEGLAILLNGQDKGEGIYELEINDDDLKISKQAAESCPVRAIEIESRDA